jgi:hypothetical protein
MRSRNKQYKKRMREQGYDRHHRKPRSRGGSNHPSNLVWVKKEQHVAFHRLFGNATPQEVARILNETWIDNDWQLIAIKKPPVV